MTPAVPLLAAVLICLLGSSRYADRERAQHALSRLGPAAVPALCHAASCPNPEVSCRAAALLARTQRAYADIWIARYKGPLPWIDMLPPDYPDRDAVVSSYLSRAQTGGNRLAGPPWPDYRLATALLARDLIRAGHNPARIRDLLEQMAGAERDWIGLNGTRYQPTPGVLHTWVRLFFR